MRVYVEGIVLEKGREIKKKEGRSSRQKQRAEGRGRKDDWSLFIDH
jgi:hypothetical protein